jgi:hypothetical protein
MRLLLTSLFPTLDRSFFILMMDLLIMRILMLQSDPKLRRGLKNGCERFCRFFCEMLFALDKSIDLQLAPACIKSVGKLARSKSKRL